MKFIRYFLILAVAIFGLSAISVNAQKYSDTKNSTRTLEQRVFKQLIKLPHYGVFDNIKYELRGSTVILSGKVADPRNKKDAEDVVEDLNGVQRVINNIEILPPSGFDNSIRRRILRTYSDSGLYRYLQEPRPSVRIIVDGGRVELEGYVINRGDYNLMNILANG
ncbi:MAG TPA: BON domain-containing protein, partial [Pyrinomonadaceae bacterium]